MTRQKKNRKVGQIGVRKLDTRPEKPKQDTKRKKAPKGQKSGNRNSLVEDKKVTISTDATTNQKKNSKIGSKKPIELVPVKSAPVEKPIQHSNKKPEVVLKKVKQNVLSPEQELVQLEKDEKLIELAERVERDELLTGKDAKYFNKHMARYDELLEILGLNDDDQDSDTNSVTKDDDESKLDQLDSNQWDDLLK